jgi:hypothetical protein
MENDTYETDSGNPMTLKKAWAIYLSSMVLFGVSMQLGWFSLGILIYLSGGFVMTKFVLNGLVAWHPVNNTIQNVFGAKMSMFFLWPITALFLLFKLTVIALL